jgi:hypothetical protein
MLKGDAGIDAKSKVMTALYFASLALLELFNLAKVSSYFRIFQASFPRVA